MKRLENISFFSRHGKIFTRRIFILSLILCTFLFSLKAQHNLLDKKVILPKKTLTVKHYLDELEKAGRFSFSYGNGLPLKKKVNTLSGEQSVQKHLNHIFRENRFKYIEKGKKILIIPDTTKQQKPKQTIHGRVIDLDSKLPIPNVNILLDSITSLKGTATDQDGYFKIKDVPVGRHELRFSYIGYEPQLISNILISSGKEQVVLVEMEEAVVNLCEVEVSYREQKSKPINDLTLISGRSFSAEEIENYPGSLSDISRAAVTFPGVVSTNDGQNHIVIRGNSPKGLQWRLEGIEIPNLNHFADIGSSGGGVSVISNNMIAGSDFLTGAFPAEYGNALSGVFDLRLRNGNNKKHEKTFQVGLIGTELMVEGPIKKETNTTYIAQYRYSTLRIFEALGVPLESVPDFQDLSFKIYHPSRKLGVFSFFGIGGLSREEEDDGYISHSNMATVGISNSYTFDPKTFIKSVVSFSGWKYKYYNESNIGTPENPINRIWNTNVTDYTVKASVNLNKKINANHKIKAGLVYELAFNNSYMGWYSDSLFNWYSYPENPGYGTQIYKHEFVDSKDNASTIQAFINWKYRINNTITINSGVHFLHFYLNNNNSLEPRIAVQWEAHPKHTFSAGFGVHSRKESMTLYSGNLTLHDGTVIQANKDLELTKAKHYVVGYNFKISNFLNLKTEAYYQYLYDIPAYPFPPYFSTINFDYGFEGNILKNYGTAFNRGIEISLEKFMSKGYHFLMNGTIYESKYKNKLGEELHTKYDGSYAANALFGKEFKVGKEKQNIFSVSSRCILMGGLRYLPIDIEQSTANNSHISIWDNGFTEKAPDYFRIDLQLRFTRNKPRYTSEWNLDIINLTNRKNLLEMEWDSGSNSLKKEYQNPLIPMITYRIRF